MPIRQGRGVIMIRVHIFLDGEMAAIQQMAHLPRTGDTVRFADELFATVTEVIWCLDEDIKHGERVNLRCESLDFDAVDTAQSTTAEAMYDERR